VQVLVLVLLLVVVVVPPFPAPLPAVLVALVQAFQVARGMLQNLGDVCNLTSASPVVMVVVGKACDVQNVPRQMERHARRRNNLDWSVSIMDG
jgi:hypothetical protein